MDKNIDFGIKIDWAIGDDVFEDLVAYQLDMVNEEATEEVPQKFRGFEYKNEYEVKIFRRRI